MFLVVCRDLSFWICGCRLFHCLGAATERSVIVARLYEVHIKAGDEKKIEADSRDEGSLRFDKF